MRRARSSLGLFPLFVVGAGTLALPASASLRPVPPVPVPVNCDAAPTLSSDATTGTCADPRYRKGCAKGAACGTQFASRYDAQYKSLKTASNTRSIILPRAMAEQTGAAFPGTVYDDALAFPAPALSATALGTGATFGDGILATAFDPKFNKLMLALQYPRYVMNEEKMSSCSEYVWKKWGTYSWFDDFAQMAGTDYDMVLSAALYPRPLGNSPRIDFTPRRWDAKTIDDAGVEMFKIIGGGTVPIALGNATPMPYRTTGAPIARNPFVSVAASWLNPADPVHAQILAVLDDKSTPIIMDYSNDVVWADVQRAALTRNGSVAANFEDNERRMNAYADLLAHLADVQDQIDRLTRPGGTGTEAPTTSASAPQFGERFFATTLERREAAIAFATEQAAKAAAANEVDPPDPDPSDPAIDSPASLARARKLAALRAELAATQAQLTKALVDEWNYDASHGCLGYEAPDPASPPGSGATIPVDVNACDFTPRMAVQRFVGLFQKERQRAYAQCIADTGDDFTILERSKAALFHAPGYDTGPSDNHLDDMQRFFYLYENRDQVNAIYDKAVEELKNKFLVSTTDLPVLGSSGGAGDAKKIGESTQDANDIGGDWFGGGYSYKAGWSITPKVQPKAVPPNKAPLVCSLSGEAGLSLEAHAKILKMPLKVLDAALKVTTKPGEAKLDQAHFTIFGKDLWPGGVPKEGDTFTGKQFDVPIDATPVDAGFSTIIPVLFIPVSVGASVTVHVGAKFSASVTPPKECDPNDIGFKIAAGITPYVTADAKAHASVDIGIASAGIEGTLNLITVNVPIKADVHMETDPATGINLAVQADADLKLSELSGKVDLFAEVNLGIWKDRATLNLFSWDGFHQSVPLFHRKKSYPIDAINYRMFNNMNPRSIR